MSTIVLQCEKIIHCKQDLSRPSAYGHCVQETACREKGGGLSSGLEVCSPFALVCWFLEAGLWALHEAARSRLSNSRKDSCALRTLESTHRTVSASGSSLTKLAGWQEYNRNLEGWGEVHYSHQWFLPWIKISIGTSRAFEKKNAPKLGSTEINKIHSKETK